MSKHRQSWARYPHLPQETRPVHWRSQLPPLLEAGATTLAFGNGRSYGDVCLAQSGQVIDTRGLDRWLHADWHSGIVAAEAGMTLAEVLAQAIPRGWFLPVTPGTGHATLGGAVANDVHGKNHHRRGTFGAHVRQLELLRSDRGFINCSADSGDALFEASVGGLGLTGIITAVELALAPIRSSHMTTVDVRFESLAEFLQLSRELDHEYEYTVAWLDCQSPRGRGVFSAANHATQGPLEVAPPGRASIPFTLPVSAINRWTLPLLNGSWFRLRRGRRQRSRHYAPVFFPLDGIANWHRLYGPQGFQQYQCVIPADQAEAAMGDLLALIARSGKGSFLSVLKQCGDIRSPGVLSFPMPGISLALDFPNPGQLTRLFSEMDRIVAQAGGRLYPAKDAHMSAADFQRAYTRWETLEQLRDPVLQSRFWHRVTQAA